VKYQDSEYVWCLQYNQWSRCYSEVCFCVFGFDSIKIILAKMATRVAVIYAIKISTMSCLCVSFSTMHYYNGNHMCIFK